MLGEILGAVGSIAGGLLGNSAAKKANKTAQANRQEDIALQREFAQNSIQWKANDAKAAGISKLAALGAPTTSYAPVSTGSTSADYSFLGNAGQNIGRAISASSSPDRQTAAIQKAGQAIQLEGLQLDNDIKRAQISSMARTQLAPGTASGAGGPYPIPGQPMSIEPPTRSQSTKTDVGTPGEPSIVPGRTPEVLLTDTVSGGYAPVLPPALQEALESQGVLAQAQYFIRNGLMPALSDNYRPKQMRAGAKPGYHYRYNPITGEYHEYKTAPYKNPRGR